MSFAKKHRLTGRTQGFAPTKDKYITNKKIKNHQTVDFTTL